MNTLLLNKNDVKSLLNVKDTIKAVENAYIAFNNNRIVQPDIMSIEIPENNGEIDFKSAYVKDTNLITMKSASGFWNNRKNTTLPNSLSSMQIINGSTGALLCIMDASLITGFRTAAAGTISAKYLARPDSMVVAMIGAGTQSRTQLKLLSEIIAIKEVNNWSMLPEESILYKKEMEKELGVAINVCATPEDAVKSADIIITVTPSKNAIVKKEWVRPGTHIIAVGADMVGKNELDASLFKDAKIVTDSTEQCIKRGETQNPINDGIITIDDIYCEIGDIISGKKDGRKSAEEITIFDTTGMAVQDNFTAKLIYDLARDKNIGKYYEFI